MTNSSDPSLHRRREQQFLEHVQKVLTDDRFRLDTTTGHRSITTLIRDVARGDRAMELKRQMSEMQIFDRSLQNAMPLGEAVEVTLSQKRWFVFQKTVGRLRVVCVSPTEALLKNESPGPMSTGDVQKALSAMPPSLSGVPQTIVLMSTSGFSPEAHALADRGGGRTVVLVAPDAVGGWNVTAPPDLQGIAGLFDPEQDDEKRSRAREEIEKARVDLLSGGVSSERLAARSKLPQSMIESEMRAFAKTHPGLVAKRLDGRFVLFREGLAGSATSTAAGGVSMPLIDRMKALFSRKGDDEKKIAFLAERRAAISQQRDRAYEEMGAMEEQEAQLKQQFKEAAGTITKKRVTSQLLQLRKDLERRQQLLGVLNQQINVVSTHLHNLELVQQGQGAQLPSTEEMTEDAVKAEEALAELEASAELAGSVAMQSGATGLTAEEQALYEELEAETKVATEPTAPAPTANRSAATSNRAGSPESMGERASRVPPVIRPENRRTEPEAG